MAKNRNSSTIGSWTKTNTGNGVTTSGFGVSTVDLFTQTSVNGNFRTPNNYSYTKVFRQNYNGSVVDHKKLNNGTPYTITLEGCLSGNFNVYPTIDVELNTIYNILLGRINERARGSLDLSIAVGESGRTKKMFKDLTKLTTWVRRFNPKNIGNLYLEWKYGVQPLAQDLYNTVDILAVNALNSRRLISRTTLPMDNSGMYQNVKYNVKGRKFGRIELILTDKVTSAQDNISSFTSLNPASIAWELLPYSFVADWIVDIGSYLRNLETAFLYGSEFSSGYITTGYSYELNCEANFTSGSPSSASFVTGQAKSLIQNTYVKRSVLATWPKPIRPTVKVSLGSSHLLSSAALLSQFIKSNPNKFR